MSRGRAGIEFGFSSTTLDRGVAGFYAQAGKAARASTIIEAKQGMVDRGADVSWLSQFSHEAEVVMPPLMAVEVVRTRVDGHVLVVEAKLALNMLSLTLEQVVGKRKKLLLDMGAQMAAEVREGREAELADAAASLVTQTLAPLLDQPALHFNVDARFQEAVAEALKTKRSVELATLLGGTGGVELADAMQRVAPLALNIVDLGKWDLAEGSADSKLIDAWMRNIPNGLTRLVIDWSTACEPVREALCELAAKTTSLVDLSLMGENARSLNILQLNGSEAVALLDLKSQMLRTGSVRIIGACLMANASMTEVLAFGFL